MAEKLVAKSFAFRRPPDQASDVHELDGAGMIFADFERAESLSRRSSGTLTMPTLGSIVQKGKLAACALRVWVTALNRADLPTFGKPTIPAFSIGPRS